MAEGETKVPVTDRTSAAATPAASLMQAWRPFDTLRREGRPAVRRLHLEPVPAAAAAARAGIDATHAQADCGGAAAAADLSA